MAVKKRQSIQVVGYAPAEAGSPGIPLAIIRAGGVGVLDLEFCDPGHGLGALRELLGSTQGRVGVRLGARAPHEFVALLDELSERPHWVIVSQAGTSSISERCSMLPPNDHRELVVEVTNAAELDLFESLPVTAIVARGHEAGGRVGEDSSLILLQKLLGATDLPVYVEGGIGLKSAAACYSAGATGVVLGAQLLMMPESPLPQAWQDELSGLAGMEARVYGERLGHPVRVLSRPGYEVTESLLQLEEELSANGASAEQWFERAMPLVGWGAPGRRAWPVGQELGLAQRYRDQYKTTGRLVKAIVAAANELPAICRDNPPLAEGSPLAQSHGTRFPIVQGPMTRVSDCPEFADNVADAGGLPFFALALMSGEQALTKLTETSKLLGDKPWGVGLLGFVPQQLRDAQVKAIFEVKPPFALIAGGRPDQAAEFERNGIPAYIHVPAPELLKLFLEQGATHFVFEGRECGGHVGPLSSLVLWETMIDVLLENVPHGKASNIHVLFAGGIHDARSAALVSVMAAPLVERGFRIGVLMGSAYLFTEEIVSSGAVKQRYQTEAIACRATINLETGPGHASRCAVSPFSHHFYAERARAMAANKSADEVRDHLEELNLGRLRLAAKGSTRGDDGQLVEVSDDEQVSEGMYMLGQVATLRDEAIAVEDLHRDVSDGSAALLGKSPARTAKPKRKASPSDIAIIGIGTLLPKAPSADQYWLNIINKIKAYTEIPRHRWDSRLYFDADRTAEDKIYSKWGGFLDEVAFDPMQYGIPPTSLKSIEPLQLLALETARRAFEDAGYADGDFDREHTSVILGAGGGAADLGTQYAVRSELPMFVETPLDASFDRLPEWTENSFPGLLLNVVAGRIANRFDLGGTNFIVDAACASSLAAFDIAVSELESGRSKVALVGGVDATQSPFGFMCFSKTQALSPRGEANTFDKRGDGIVISEGLAMVVLKPLADAERDGDRIYSVIKSVGSSSDGKALGLTAPLPAGQMRALNRAYEKAGVSPSTLGLIEAHGTGTAVGDSAELETIVETLQREKAGPKSIAIGSVKSQLGHTKATAGTAGLVKAVLALHHKVLPPHVGVENPLDPIAADDSPVYLLNEARPWLSDNGAPRRAGVSSFGFGGTNFHVVLEEYGSEFRPKAQPLGASDWPVELFVFRAADAAALKGRLTRIVRNLDTGAQPRLADLAYTCAVDAERSDGSVQAALLVQDLGELSRALDALVKVLDGGDSRSLPLNVQLHLGFEDDEAPTVAFLFPGQGAQHPGMLREPTMYLRESREAIEHADTHLHGCFSRPLSQLIYPPQAFDEEHREAQEKALTDTHVAQPAIVTASLGNMGILRRVGVFPDMAAGHSLGEYVALHAAGVMSREVLLDLSETRGRAMAAANVDGDAGSMAVVMATREEVEAYIADYPGVVLANHNAPTQCAISGVTAEVLEVVEKLTEKGVMVVKLPVAGAFHSPLMEAAQSPLKQAIEEAELNPPTLSVYGNTTGSVYSDSPAAIREQLQAHMLGSVQFVDQVENMYRDGASVFLEVGPKNVLTGLVDAVLNDRPHKAIATDDKEGGLRGILGALAQLVGCGVEIKASALFEDRAVSRLPQTLQAPSLPATAWMVDGGGIRRPDDPVRKTGKTPPLTVETREQSAAELATRVPAAQPAAPPAAATAAQPTVAAAPAAPVAPEPAVPNPAGVAQPVPAPSSVDAAVQIQALDLYHNTMRQFLAVQEGVMKNFLGGDGMAAGSAADAQIPAAPAVAPVMVQPGHDLPAQLSRAEAPAPALASPVSTAPEVPIAPTPVAPASAAAPGLSRDDLLEMVLRLTADRTGYPVEMLDLEQDIEAELGIDSIKRVEIVGALTKELPESMQAALQADVEALTRAKTLGVVIDGLAAHLPGQGAPREAQAPVEHATARLADVAPLIPEVPRFTMTSRVKSRPDARLQPDSGLYLVSDDGGGLASAVIEELRRRGGEAILLTQGELEDSALLGDALDNLRSSNTPVIGVVHLACCSDGGSMGSFEAWRSAGNRHIKSLFRLLKSCASDIGSQQVFRVLNVSCNGGHFGRNGQITSPTAGGSVGLLKSAAAEWPQLQIKNLDLAAGNDFHAETIIDELLCEPDAVEVGYSGDERRVFFTAPAQLTSDSPVTDLVPQPDWVVLATGGARGITFSVLEAVVPDGATVVLMARSPEPETEPEEIAKATDSAALRTLIIHEEQARGEKPSIVAVKKRVNAIMRDRAVRTHINALRQRGIKVDYHQADVSDERQCNAAIDAIYERHGRIDAVLHGAGIIEDKLIVDKSQESFDRVFDTKSDSGYLLSQRLRPDSLKWLMFFTSVAGRYGNRGQSDYAAGNEVLNRLAWYLNTQWTSTRVVSVNWGPWDSSGMVSEGVKRQFAKLGIMAINPQAGASFARHELFQGSPNDVEVVAGQGPWDSGTLAPQGPESTPGTPSGFNLVLADSIPQLEPTGAVSTTREVSLASDPYLEDHRLDGDPVMPAAVGAELMAETTQLAWPDLVVAEVQDVRVLQGIQFKDGESTSLRVRCRASSHADAAAVKVNTEITDTRSGGRVAYRAGVLLRDRLPEAPLASLQPLRGGEPLNVIAAYRDYLFHGPRFQLITAIHTVNEQGIDAEVRGSDAMQWIDKSRRNTSEGSPPSWLFDPGLVDVNLQICLIWERIYKGMTALPARFGTIRRYQFDRMPETLLLRCRARPESAPNSAVFDAEFLAPDGRVFMAMEDIDTIGSERFNRLGDDTDESGKLIITNVGQAG